MYILLTVLIIIVAILLILIVLVQNSKGGGLASNFSSSNQVMGVRKTTDFLEKATWTLAVSLVVLSILSSMAIPKGDEEEESIIKEQIETTVDPGAIPQMPPTTQPSQNQNQNNNTPGDNQNPGSQE